MLHEFQTHFLKGIYDVTVENDAYSYIQETEDRTAGQQLSIYRGGIFGGLKKALAETYPITKDLVGEDFFNAMLSRYITAYPCKVQDLNDYGEELGHFIGEFKPAQAVPYLADVAHLEWLYNISLNAKVQKNNLAGLSSLTHEQQMKIKLSTANGSGLIQSSYPVDEIWNMHWYSNNDVININNEKLFLIVFNHDFEIKVDRLNNEQFVFLSEFNSDKKFSDVCEEFNSVFPSVSINALFAESIQRGWLRSYAL